MTLRIIVFLGLANNDKSAYDSETPRKSNTVEHLGEALFKLQCAHDNTIETVVVATVAVIAASNLGLDVAIFAKLSMFNLLARAVYPALYVFAPDMIRSLVFTFGFFSSLMIITYSLFPKVI